MEALNKAMPALSERAQGVNAIYALLCWPDRVRAVPKKGAPSAPLFIAFSIERVMYDQTEFPCPCCGRLVFEREPGFHKTCPICGWEDDLAQLRFPLMPGSANTVSLFEAQQNFQRYGVSERRNLGHTRDPVEGETIEPGWRPLDPNRDNPERPSRGNAYGDSYPWPDTTVLYYWRSTYWRRLVG